MGKAIPLVQPLWVAMITFRMWSLGSRGDPMIAGWPLWMPAVE
jgi:hypothetical protein